MGAWAGSLCHPQCVPNPLRDMPPLSPPTEGAVAQAATRTPLTLHPPSPGSIPAPRGSPSGRSRTPPAPRWGRCPGESPLTSTAGPAARAVAAQGDTGRGQDLSPPPHPPALCPLVKAGEGRGGQKRLAQPPPLQSPWVPQPAAGRAGTGVPPPQGSPSPGPGVGELLPGRTQPCHPQDSVPLPAGKSRAHPKAVTARKILAG